MSLRVRSSVAAALLLLPIASCGGGGTVRPTPVPPVIKAPSEAFFDKYRDSKAKFVVPSVDDQRRFEAWVKGALAAPSADRFGVPPAPFVVQRIADRADVFAVVEAGPTVGGGAYFIRVGSAAPLVVEVPHSFSDRHTLPMGLDLFDALRAKALLVNTVHRYRGADSAEDDVVRPADMAHTTESYFHAFHLASVGSLSGALVIAVHGFEAKDEDPDVIVSNGNTNWDPAPVAAALTAAFDDARIALFPVDIQRLGGTQGAQATQLRATGGRLLHLEVSHRLRERLRNDVAARARFADAVARGLGVHR